MDYTLKSLGVLWGMLVVPIWLLWMHHYHITPTNRAINKTKTYIIHGIVTWKRTMLIVKSTWALVKNKYNYHALTNFGLHKVFNLTKLFNLFRSHIPTSRAFGQSKKVRVQVGYTSKWRVRQTRRETKRWNCRNNIATKSDFLRYQY